MKKVQKILLQLELESYIFKHFKDSKITPKISKSPKLKKSNLCNETSNEFVFFRKQTISSNCKIFR